MPIYPVYLAAWYPSNPKSENYDEHMNWAAKTSVHYTACNNCGAYCKWKKAWGHHAIPWGYGDVWCSKKCLKG